MSVNIRGIGYTLFALCLPIWALALYQGQSPESVLDEMGPPNGTRVLASGELWVYSGDITLEFENDRLIRSKGLDLLPSPPPGAPEEASVAREAGEDPEEAEPAVSSMELTPESLDERSATDDDLMETAEAVSRPESLLAEEDLASSGSSSVEEILAAMVPIFLQWLFLIIAFKFTGAEGSKLILFGIAVVDRLVILGVQWVFIGLLEFPMTFHADTLLSILVMLALITSFTHAKRLDTAIKVVVASKVAAFLAGWIFVMFLLSQF